MCLSPQVDHGLQHDQHEQQRNQVLNLQDRHDRGAEQYGQVSLSLGLIENPSVSCAEVGCVLQTLKDQVPAIRAETVPAQRSQRERMGRVVGQVELTFQAQFTPLSISKTPSPCIKPYPRYCSQSVSIICRNSSSSRRPAST